MTDLEALGKRLVACKHFRPMRGMRDLHGRTWDEALLWRWSNEFDVPDLSDAATLGCVLELVREGHADECACVFPIDYGPGGVRWVARLTAGGRDMTQQVHGTEAEALVAALEAAP